ncbi:hypothetical protein L249_7177 [Ophiocordyceps polyrhachis-furcata BCC 54312]|uniref:ORC6 first cyclin-like domain-containing protein n=1 Tax=Ophiocordyceps polyrhachis-furcata BCC 54312 TaxID=1330021 RepID=A0A367LBA7_9HYPO|nr:hypothetical protein L249_7177 [Ophiocordyceps polyrhachis-furcata BCC 54312]
MNKQLEQALLSLMPAHGSDLPPSLVEQAASLLAQSRNRASALKADEEIARPYACANIACERLKTTLDLPPIEPRPPIPPRLYKRLYTHLDNILPITASRGNLRRKQVSSTPARMPTGEALVSGTPSAKTVAETPTRWSRRRRRAGEGDDDVLAPGELYPWMIPVVRFLCAEAGIAKFAPTVLAGIAFVQRQQGTAVGVGATGLVAALFHHVVTRLRTWSRADEEAAAAAAAAAAVDREACANEVIANLGRARNRVQHTKSDEADFWRGWKTIQLDELDSILAGHEDWLDGDWFTGISDVVVVVGRTGTNADGFSLDGHGEAGGGHSFRADTMFQEQHDFLSQRRRAEYRLWREKILAKMDRSLRGAGHEGTKPSAARR